ncbi:hypothetical protein Tco_0122061 [Tanacetum coccineum]
MGYENPIRTLGDYSKPSHEGYRNTIELPKGNNVVPLRFDTIRLVQNGCSFHGHRSEDPNQHLKDFLKLVDSLDLDVANRERTRLRSISTWEDLTTRFLVQFFPPGRTAKLLPHHGIDLWVQVQIFYDHVNPVTRRTIDQSAGGKLRDRNAEKSWVLLEDLALYNKESWNDPRDFAKPVKAISLPQDVPSTSDRRLIELENQVQRLMEAHLAPKQPVQVNKSLIHVKSVVVPTTLNIAWKILSKRLSIMYLYEQRVGRERTQSFISPQKGSFSTYSSSYQAKLERTLSEFDSHQERRLSSLGVQLGRQQDDMINKINILWKIFSEKIDDTSTRDTT